jgi:hypothetical protein
VSSSVAEQIERDARCMPFPVVEEMIDELPLGNDQKAALWLVAWSVQPGEVRRGVAHETLAALERVRQ